jgi:hypothetical protein
MRYAMVCAGNGGAVTGSDGTLAGTAVRDGGAAPGSSGAGPSDVASISLFVRGLPPGRLVGGTRIGTAVRLSYGSEAAADAWQGAACMRL